MREVERIAERAGQRLDLTGQQYGKLTALGPAENIGNRTAWRCDCGQDIVVLTRDLRRARRTSS